MVSSFCNILDLKDKFDIFLFDAYGVFWDGEKFYNASREAMEELVNSGKIVCVLSNTTAVSSVAEDTYARKGLFNGIHYNFMITSGVLCRDLLLREKLTFKNKKNPIAYYQFGTPNNKLFEGTKYQATDKLNEADFIYISIPQLKENEYEKLKEKYGNYLFESTSPKDGMPRKWDSTKVKVFEEQLKELLESGLPILSCNPDYTAPESVKGQIGVKNFVIRQGAIAEELRKLGAEVVEFGKPYREIYEYTFDTLEKAGIKLPNLNKICMVGDTLRTDIKGANNAGIKSILCLETGVTANEIKKGAKLEDLIKEEDVVVDYFINGVGAENK